MYASHSLSLPSTPKLLATAVSTVLAGTGTVNAQDFAIEEVVVTATKRAESLQDIPLAVTAFTTEDIEKRGFTDFEDYAKYVPGLSFGKREPGGTSIVFRGVASSGLQYGARASSCVYLDEQPITAAGTNPDPRLVDAERLEALRGPQGTLFGDSCQSGALRVIMNKPDTSGFDSWIEGQGSTVEDGDFGYDFSGMVNVPVGDQLAIRLTGFYEDESSYIDNVLGPSPGGTFSNAGQNEEDINQAKHYGFRGALRWQPNDDWTVDVTGMYQDTNVDGFNDVNFDVGDLEQLRFVPEKFDDEWYQIGLTVEAKLGWADAVVSASYFDRKFFYQADAVDYQFAFQQLGDYLDTLYPYYNLTVYDFGGDPSGAFGINDVDTESWTVEARLTTPADSDSRWRGLVGFFYNKTKDFANFESGNDNMALGAPAFYYLNYLLYYYTGQLAAPTTNWFFGIYDNTLEQFSLFSEFSFDFTDNLTITAGGRWFSIEEDRLTRIGALKQEPIGAIPNFNTSLVFTDEAANTSEVGFVPKVNIEYHVDDDKMIYFTFSRGFRNGGGNTVRRQSILSRSFDSDFLTNYEVGGKSTWLNGRLQVNVAAYTMIWKNIQIQVNDPQPAVFALGFENFPRAEINGIEADFRWIPAENWDLGGSVAYNEAEISENATLFPGSAGPLAVTAGQQLPLALDWQASAWMEYNFPNEFFGATPFVRFDFSYTGESLNSLSGIEPIVAGLGQATVQDPYEIGDLKIGLEADKWRAVFFVDNVWDERGDSFISNRWGKQRRSINKPRTIGFTVRRSFN